MRRASCKILRISGASSLSIPSSEPRATLFIGCPGDRIGRAPGCLPRTVLSFPSPSKRPFPQRRLPLTYGVASRVRSHKRCIIRGASVVRQGWVNTPCGSTQDASLILENRPSSCIRRRPAPADGDISGTVNQSGQVRKAEKPSRAPIQSFGHARNRRTVQRSADFEVEKRSQRKITGERTFCGASGAAVSVPTPHTRRRRCLSRLPT
jgi:hypothetical protein